MTIMETLADLHAHLVDSWKTLTPKGNRFFGVFNSHKNFPRDLLLKCFETAQKTRTDILTTIVNFDDDRTTGIFEEIKRYSQHASLKDFRRLEYAQKGKLLSVRVGDLTTHFLPGREIRTENGDILLIGNGDDIPSRKASDVFKTAKKRNDSLILVPHMGFPKIGMRLTTAINYRDYIDAVEGKVYATEVHRAELKASDSHTLRYLFSQGLIFNNFDPENPVESLREGLSTARHYQTKKQPGYCEMARHVASFKAADWLLASGICTEEKAQ